MGIRKLFSCRSKKGDAVPHEDAQAKVKLNELNDVNIHDKDDKKFSTPGDSPRSIIQFENNPSADALEKATTNSKDRKRGERGGNSEKNEPTGDYSLYTDKGVPIYVTKQSHGFLCILISLAQTGILTAMIIKCGIAPFSINPMLGPYPDALSNYGGKNAYDILYNEEWWRLFSSVLLHAGICHLICNVAIQLGSGAFYEKEWGSPVFLVIYAGSAVAGGALSTVVSPSTIGVGSSSSICGLFGAKIAETICRCCEPRKTNNEKVRYGVLMKEFASTMFSIILIALFSFIPYVDWAAHVGGALGGFSLGIIIFSFKIKTLKWRLLWLFFGMVLGAMFYSVVFFFMYQESQSNVAEEMGDVCSFYMKIFDNYKCKCMLERYENDNDAA